MVSMLGYGLYKLEKGSVDLDTFAIIWAIDNHSFFFECCSQKWSCFWVAVEEDDVFWIAGFGEVYQL